MNWKIEDNFRQEDTWDSLKQFTNARIALGNVGGSLPLNEILAFKLAHANAKDAIYSELDIQTISTELAKFQLPIFHLKTQVPHRQDYLRRPDLGRKLNQHSVELLENETQTYDIVFLLTDGLSANGVNTYALDVLNRIIPSIKEKFTVAFALVEQGRVAIGDEIGALLHAKFTALMIGERPGLSSPESMGIYTTFNPSLGLTDERRNCISNIHEEGLSIENSSKILQYLIEQSFARQVSGVELKVEMGKLKN